ncbi:ATP synthase subunit I [Salibacterium salarium]|uniref:ATP synthase subunit I n=2 Tax=Salibacterium salarium TaxID=284579 RepID=A0A3R9P793_9BACI|nr:ATP synthase subunit I [Salibacterium salarium]RSL31809.1 ATP synthase subunit I [Salibacterium salarium]
MKSFGAHIKRYVQLTFYVFIFYLLGWGFTPYSELFFSLGVGAVIGLYNMWSMYRDVKKIGDAAEKQKQAFTFGMLPRMATGVLAAILIVRFPEYFHIAGLVAGIMTPYIIILLHSLLKGTSSK